MGLREAVVGAVTDGRRPDLTLTGELETTHCPDCRKPEQSGKGPQRRWQPGEASEGSGKHVDAAVVFAESY